MRARVAAALLVAACACGKRDDKPPDKHDKPARREVTGTLSLDGKPLEVAQCRAGRGVTTYVELVTAQGTLRFEDKQLFWASSAASDRGERLQCDKLDRSWGGGLRKDGTSYFRGHLIFRCRGPAGEQLAGDVQVDCGAITPEERAELDKNRDEMRRQQQAGSATPDAAP